MTIFNLDKFAKFLSISAFVMSNAVLFVYGNYLMLFRPTHKVIRHGFVYPFFGKGEEIFISATDYSIILISGAMLFLSVIATNRLYRPKR